MDEERVPAPSTRRQWLRWMAGAALAAPLWGCAANRRSEAPAAAAYSGTDEQLLDEIERAAFRFFWEEASAKTGQIKDRALANGNDTRTVSSIAATGFGLTGLCIGAQRGYGKAAEIAQRVRTTLDFLLNRMPHHEGYFFHFVDMNTGERVWKCELSSIDTAILVCGVLTARAHFADPEVKRLATAVYERVNWPWMLNGGSTLSMGWKPESGFLADRWDRYCELMMLYLLAVGSPSHPLDATTWRTWSRPWFAYQGLRYIQYPAPLFVHQYSHAWYDFRGRRDGYANYFQNSITATRAHKLFCLSLRDRFPKYSDSLWGITSSDSINGYQAWGGPPPMGKLDGSVVPCAAAGSLPFLKDECLAVLRSLRGPYAGTTWKKYGFVDAFNPNTGWADPDVIGIDLGITMLMAENARTGFVWQTFMKNPEAASAMTKVGFHAST